MKWSVSGGRIVEGFQVLPSISVNWAIVQDKNKLPDNFTRIYDIQFSWLFWYFTIGQIGSWLKESGWYDR